MFIELRGVEFVNKGAELMLHAIIQHLSNELDHVEFVMETSHRSPKEKLAELGIWQKVGDLAKGQTSKERSRIDSLLFSFA